MKFLMKLAYYLRALYWRVFRPLTLGCRAIVVRGESVLLVHHTYLKGWSLPGGAVDRGETCEAATRREVKEETGIDVDALRLMSVYLKTKGGNSDHISVFIAEASRGEPLSGGTPGPSAEISDCRFFRFDDLPKDLWPGHRRRIEEYRTGTTPTPHW